MIILGFMGYASHDTGVCVIKTCKDGTFNFSTIAEERLNRIKYSYHFPLRSLDYCMRKLNINSLEEIDLVVNDWSQNRNLFGSNAGYRRLEFDYIRQRLKIPRSKIHLIPSHHLAHAYSTFIPSGFEKAAVLIVDGLGSGLQGSSLYYAEGTKIEHIESGYFFSVGMLYEVVTRKILNFDVGEEGKTMGLAAFGAKYAEREKILNIQGKYNGMNVDYGEFMTRIPDNSFIKEFKKCKDKKDLYNQYFSQIAYEVQCEVEKAMLHFAEYAKKVTGANYLCIAGGVGLNCVANEKIRKSKLFKKLFIQPASSDAGIPFGLALYGYYHTNPESKYKPEFKDAYFGKSYSDSSIKNTLRQNQIPYKETCLDEVAKLLTQKNVIGWFTGGSEFGSRALGHRSIIADPHYKDMKEILNIKVKHREAYRPFAPSILADVANDYFDLDGDLSPYMLFAPQVDIDKKNNIQSGVHYDGTGRVQTVTKENSQDFYDIIKAFGMITGIPVVINTSFNDNNEPIVETPLDALVCFLRTKIDYLVFNSKFMVSKKEIKNLDKRIVTISRDRQESLKSEYLRLLRKYTSNYSVSELKYFLKRNQYTAKYYREYKPYDKLVDFLKTNTKFHFIGDDFHKNLLENASMDLLDKNDIVELKIMKDSLENIDQILSFIEANLQIPVLCGFYNITEFLKNRIDGQQVYFLYDDYQTHLQRIYRSTENTKVHNFDDISYSCEYNLSKDFDSMF